MKRIIWLAFAGLIAAGFSRTAPAQQWTQFRGPNNSGVIAAGTLPVEWSTEKNVAWKIEVPGVAWSQPVVWEDKVFVTTAITEKQEKPKAGGGFGGGRGPGGPGGGFGPPGGFKKSDGAKKGDGGKKGGPGRGGPGGFGGFGNAEPPDVVYRWEIHCLDRNSGKTVWSKLAKEGKPTIAIHSTNTYASETPVTDGKHLYVYFGMHGLYCFDLEGNQVWSQDLGTYPMQFGWGTGSSLAFDGDRLFVQCDNEKQSFLVALDKKSGKELWRAKREAKSTWGTPFIRKSKDRTEVVTCGGNRIDAYDATSGKSLWYLEGVGGDYKATPVADEERLYVGAGRSFMGGMGPLFAVKAGAAGNISLEGKDTSNAHIAWSKPTGGPSMASPLVYQGLLYILEQRGGMISCYDAKTGDLRYEKKRIPDATGFTSSPWANDGKIFCLDEGGQTTVLKAGPDFEVLHQNKLDEMCWSSPAFADGSMLLRTVDRLYCIK